MARRALVLGSQIEGLRGVDNDTRRMAEMLEAREFVVDLRIGADATRAGMLAGYDQLIRVSAPGDAAVVYYCGHGFYAPVPDEGRSWQCIAPTDLRAGTDDDWRGITAWELSMKQAELTGRTRNVTVILDCCHSAQLSRNDSGAGAVPRGLPHPVRGGFDRHLAELRAIHGAASDAVDAVGNQDAVRLIACGRTESAFEYCNASGEYHGVFTDALIDIVHEVGSAAVSWAAIIGAVRTRVLRHNPRQRPDVEGPARRGVFSLAEHDEQRRVAVSARGERFRIAAGELTGAAVGDVYAVYPADVPIRPGARSLAELEVVEVFATTSIARRTGGEGELPRDAVAVAIRRCLPKWPVAITAPDSSSDARVAAERAIEESATLRLARPDEPNTLAMVRIASDAATIEDDGGPLFLPVPIPLELGAVTARLANMGVAQGLRELEGEHGVSAGELAIELSVMRGGRPQPLPDHGSVLGLADRYCLTITRRGDRPTLFVHAFNIDARGKVLRLTHFAPGGVAIDRHEPLLMLGQRADGEIIGVGLLWPDGLPKAEQPRLSEFLVIATPVLSDLSGLEARELVQHDRNGCGLLLGTLVQLCDGNTRSVNPPRPLDAFYVKRLSILLSPSDILCGEGECATS